MTEQNGNAWMLSVKEAAALLNVSEKTVRKLMEQDDLPHAYFGRVIRIPRIGLERWMYEKAGIGDTPSQGVELSSTLPKH